jgi:hypothetical protein
MRGPCRLEGSRDPAGTDAGPRCTSPPDGGVGWWSDGCGVDGCEAFEAGASRSAPIAGTAPPAGAPLRPRRIRHMLGALRRVKVLNPG